jgi:hypothetical protein
MTSPVLRTAALNSSPGSIDAFKGLPGSSPGRPDSSLANENQVWQGRRERAWQSHSRDRGRRQAPVCSRERGAGLTERAQATTGVPDVPLGTFLLDLEGGSKGLLINSEDLCAKQRKAAVRMTGQNGATYNVIKSKLQTSCGPQSRHKRLHRHVGRARNAH